MNKFLLRAIISMSCILLFAACDDGNLAPLSSITSDVPTAYKDLEIRENVLFNLELAYDERNLSQVDRLLDDDFVFYFGETDRTSYGMPDYWLRPAEVMATSNLFDANYSPPNLEPVTKIDFELSYSDLWHPIAATGQHAGETWYSKAVVYYLRADAGSVLFLAENKRAAFVVRQEGREWRLVEVYDDLLAARSANGDAAAPVHDMTWGRLKNLYNPQ
jgi:hypothetical protein